MVPLLITYYLITTVTQKKRKEWKRILVFFFFFLVKRVLLVIDEREPCQLTAREHRDRELWQCRGPDYSYIFGQTFTFRNKDGPFRAFVRLKTLCNASWTFFCPLFFVRLSSVETFAPN